MQYAGNELSRLLTQYGLANQNVMNQNNLNLLNSQLNNQNMWGGLSGIAYNAGNQGWFTPSGSTSSGSGSSTSGLGSPNYSGGLGLGGGFNSGGWQNWTRTGR